MKKKTSTKIYYFATYPKIVDRYKRQIIEKYYSNPQVHKMLISVFGLESCFSNILQNRDRKIGKNYLYIIIENANAIELNKKCYTSDENISKLINFVEKNIGNNDDKKEIKKTIENVKNLYKEKYDETVKILGKLLEVDGKNITEILNKYVNKERVENVINELRNFSMYLTNNEISSFVEECDNFIKNVESMSRDKIYLKLSNLRKLYLKARASTSDESSRIYLRNLKIMVLVYGILKYKKKIHVNRCKRIKRRKFKKRKVRVSI